MNDAPTTYLVRVCPLNYGQIKHINVAFYFKKSYNAVWNSATKRGPFRSLIKARGISPAAVTQNITYKRELPTANDIFNQDELIELAPKKIRFRDLIANGETIEVSTKIGKLAIYLYTTVRCASGLPMEIMDKNCSYMLDQVT